MSRIACFASATPSAKRSARAAERAAGAATGVSVTLRTLPSTWLS